MANHAHANEWLNYAKMDFAVAVHNKTLHPLPIEIICFHCQQASEKALQSILAYYENEIPRTHNILEILRLCEMYYPGLTEQFIVQADRLTNFAVVTRYPLSEMEITETDMELALKGAEQILIYVNTLW